MRGPRLLDEAVRAELERARRRGANVTVLDEGGLEGLDEASLADHPRRSSPRRCARRARTASTSARRRTRRVAVTVVGRSAAGAGL